MKIKIDSIIAEGFRSLATNTTVNLDRPGLNLVKGENGAGKTTLFEALVWCLYGTNLKGTNVDKVPTWKEVRPEGWRGTYVEVLLSVDDVTHRVVRTIAWNGGHGIAKNGLLLARKSGESWVNDYGIHKKEVQESVDKLFGLDAQTFMSSILFGQRMSKLVESDNTDKRELFEKLFETAFVNSARANAKEELHELTGKEAEAQSDFLVATNTATQKQEDIDERGRMITHFEVSQEQRIKGVTRDIETSSEVVSSLLDQVAGCENTVKDWDGEFYDKFQEDCKKFRESYLKIEGTGNTLYEKVRSATGSHGVTLDNHQRAVNTLEAQKEIDKTWGMNRVERLAQLNEKFQGKVKEMTEELLAVVDVCPECEQDLPKENVETVKASITTRHTKIIDAIKAEIDEVEASTPPPSRVPELTEAVQVALDAIKPAKAVLEAAETSYNDHLASSREADELNREYDEAEGEWTKAKQSFDSAKDSIVSFQNEINTEAAKTEILEGQLETIKKEKMPAFDNTVEELEEQRDTAINDANHAQSVIDDINKEMDRYDWWMKKGYSSSGIPAFVFKSMLDKLNDKVIKYADRLGVSAEFSIDLTKAAKPFTTICSVGDKVDKEYKEFSGGEKQRLDIVLIFAMHDLVSIESDINILILDEVFEGLDEAGEAAVFELVRTKAEDGKSIYIITHSPHIDSLYSSTLTMIADKTGATKIQ